MLERPLGLHGAVWCVIAGLCYGVMQVSAKLGYDAGLTVAQFMLIRHICLWLFSYILGKTVRGVDFNLCKRSWSDLKFPLIQAVCSVFGKGMSYASFAMIPLTISGCIFFTMSPIFGALVGLMFLCEKLTVREMVTISLSILATLMVIMPQWFVFLGLDQDAEQINMITERLKEDMSQYGEISYYLGIVLLLVSIFFDNVVNFSMRSLAVQTDVPYSYMPFVQGIVCATLSLIYILIMEPEKLISMNGTSAGHAFFAGFMSWIGQETLLIGLAVSKSALGMYGQQSGLIVPILFDVAIAQTRYLLVTDSVGLTLIVGLQVANIAMSLYYDEAKNSSEIDEEENSKSKLLSPTENSEKSFDENKRNDDMFVNLNISTDYDHKKHQTNF